MRLNVRGLLAIVLAAAATCVVIVIDGAAVSALVGLLSGLAAGMVAERYRQGV